MSESKKSLGPCDIFHSEPNTAQHWLSQFEAKLNSQAQAECFKTRNKMIAQYASFKLRRFSRPQKDQSVQTLIISPLGVHDAGILDLTMGNSLIATLLESRVPGLHAVEWNRVTPDSPDQSIDTCLADLNIALDDLGGRVNLVGLCLGGLFALMLAARFPGKVERLVLAGTPVDLEAQLSTLTLHARKLTHARPSALPLDMAAGEHYLAPLAVTGGAERMGLEILQRDPGSFARSDLQALQAFETWAERKYDLSASYIRDILSRIGTANELARGQFIALGRRIDLKSIRAPLFVLAGTRDEIAPPKQALAIRTLIGTTQARQRHRLVPVSHLSLFAGRQILKHEWRMIAGWLQSHANLRQMA